MPWQASNRRLLREMEGMLLQLCRLSLGTARLLQACTDTETAMERRQLLQVLVIALAKSEPVSASHLRVCS